MSSLAMDLLGVLLIGIACFGLLALSNPFGLPPHTEQVTQEPEEEAQG